jgi:hypothetical protein
MTPKIPRVLAKNFAHDSRQVRRASIDAAAQFAKDGICSWSIHLAVAHYSADRLDAEVRKTLFSNLIPCFLDRGYILCIRTDPNRPDLGQIMDDYDSVRQACLRYLSQVSINGTVLSLQMSNIYEC